MDKQAKVCIKCFSKNYLSGILKINSRIDANVFMGLATLNRKNENEFCCK